MTNTTTTTKVLWSVYDSFQDGNDRVAVFHERTDAVAFAQGLNRAQGRIEDGTQKFLVQRDLLIAGELH